MPTQERKAARLNFRLSHALKELIEEAAAQLGQSVSDFAVSTLVRDARDIVQKSETIRLSNRDRDHFLDLLKDTAAKPTKALTRAAKKYKKHIG